MIYKGWLITTTHQNYKQWDDYYKRDHCYTVWWWHICDPNGERSVSLASVQHFSESSAVAEAKLEIDELGPPSPVPYEAVL